MCRSTEVIPEGNAPECDRKESLQIGRTTKIHAHAANAHTFQGAVGRCDSLRGLAAPTMKSCQGFVWSVPHQPASPAIQTFRASWQTVISPYTTFSPPPLNFRTVGFSQYGFKRESNRNLRRSMRGLSRRSAYAAQRSAYMRPPSCPPVPIALIG